MREIEFRGKRLDNGKWVYGYFGELEVFNGNEHISGSWINDRQNNSFQVDPSTVGQFTGLKDKNGTGIWESDILRIKHPSWEHENHCVVEYDNGMFIAAEKVKENSCHLYWYKVIGKEYVFEVIGNVHEDGDLLGGAVNG